MRPVAIVSYASELGANRDEVELVLSAINQARGQVGIKQADIGFTCSGSSDFLVGRPFSFVMALDAVGAWPPIRESHVEMDGAWALYEAWVRLQRGDIDTALVYAFGKPSAGDQAEVLATQLDPYTLAPLWPDADAIARLQAAACGAPMPAPAPVLDGAAAIVLAAGDTARRLCIRPAWIRGIEHRVEAHQLGLRDLSRSSSTAAAAEAAGAHVAADAVIIHAPYENQADLVRDALRAPGAEVHHGPLMVAGLMCLGEAATRIHNGASRTVAHATEGPALQHNLVAVLEAEKAPTADVHMHTRCAVVGIGQTRYAAKRKDLSIPGLVREAATRALADAKVSFADIDAVVIGKAPDMFEGIMMPELYLADALGAAGKPIFRVHTAGSVGGSTAVVATHLIESGVHKRVLTVAFEKQSESNAMWALSPQYPFQPPTTAGAGGYFAPLIRAYMRRSNAPGHIGTLVAVKDRQNALRNPLAHLHVPGITREMVEASPMLWDPIRYLETCPSSDGACAMVLVAEDSLVGPGGEAPDAPPAWVRATAMRSEPIQFPGRDQVLPRAGADCAADLYAKAGITNPREEIDVAEIYVPFSWFEPMWLENLGLAGPGEGWKMVESGATSMEGDLPVNPSGGVMSSNPIGASGMIRFAEAARQVRGQAADHQVPGAKVALGHAYGGGSQFFSMWIVASE